MAYSVPVENYVRSPQPALPESQLKYLQEELKKLERVNQSVSDALSQLEPSTDISNVVSVSSSGLVLKGGNTLSNGVGIAFPVTQSASSDANTLDDYEEGSWTPRLSGTSGGNYTPGGVNEGRYVKIGKTVWATCTLGWTAQVTPYSGNLIVTGLPFISAGVRSCGSIGAVANGISFSSGYSEWNYLIDPNYTFVYIIQNATSGSGYSHAPVVSSTGQIYALTIVYETAS